MLRANSYTHALAHALLLVYTHILLPASKGCHQSRPSEPHCSLNATDKQQSEAQPASAINSDFEIRALEARLREERDKTSELAGLLRDERGLRGKAEAERDRLRAELDRAVRSKTNSSAARFANDNRGQRSNSKFVYDNRNQRVNLRSTRQIPPGDEIFVHYGADYWR